MVRVKSAERMVNGQRFKCEAERIILGNAREEIEVKVFLRVPGLLRKYRLLRVDYYAAEDVRSVDALFDESLQWVI